MFNKPMFQNKLTRRLVFSCKKNFFCFCFKNIYIENKLKKITTKTLILLKEKQKQEKLFLSWTY
jgi:hypothetical protein